MDAPLLEVRDLTLRFGGVTALNQVSFEVHPDELFAVIGPNGAGKTSIFNCLSAVYRPQAGEMLLDGTSLWACARTCTAQLGIGRTFQNLGLFVHLDVDRQPAPRPPPPHVARASWPARCGSGKARREELVHRAAVEEIVDLLELSAYRRQPVGMLPYGVQKRIELGRALAMEPRLLLLDEPVAGMNLEETEDMARYIIEIRQRLRLPMVLVEHDMHMVMDLADRVMALDFGVVIATGTSRRRAERPPRDRGLPGRCGMTAVLETPAAHGGHATVSLPSTVLRRAAAEPDRVAIRKKDRGRWKTYSWGDYADRVTTIARGLAELGVEPGDRVAIHSENRPAWLFADLATQALGGISVGIYPTSPAAEVEYLLNHSGAKVLVRRGRGAGRQGPGRAQAAQERCERIVVIDPRGVDVDDDLLMTLAELEALGRASSGSTSAASAAAVDLAAPAIIVYTSGTTGPPKGAMLSHHNLLSAAANSGAGLRRRRAHRGAVVPAAVPHRRAPDLRDRCRGPGLRRELRRRRRDVPPGPPRGAAHVLPRRAARVGEAHGRHHDPHGRRRAG